VVPAESPEGRAITALRHTGRRLTGVEASTFCAEVAATLRRFVAEQAGLAGELLTTSETRETMETAPLPAGLGAAITAALNATDRVRFARGSFSPDKAQALLRWLEEELAASYTARAGAGQEPIAKPR
jgi:hypothetical protein